MNVGELFVRMAMDFSQYDRDEAIAQKRVATLGSSLSGILKGAFSFTLGMGMFKGVTSLGGILKDFVLTAGRTETLNVAMLAVAHSTGLATDVLGEHKEAVMDLGIAEQEADQILTRFAQSQLDTANAAKIARVAQDAAVISGENSSQAAGKMTEAIAKQRPELLSAYGMTRNLNDIYADYAKTLNKKAKQLTETERKQAMLNYILKEGEKIAGTYERSMGSAFKKLGSLTRYVDTFKNAVATPLALPAFGVIIDGITDAFKRGINWAEANKAVLQAWGQTVANATKTALKWVWTFGSFITRNWGTIAVTVRTGAMAFMSYYGVVGVLKLVALATEGVTLASKIMAGELLTTNIVTGFLSRAFGIYRLQLHLASIAGIAHVGVLQAVRTALYSVWTALGPIGWAVLALVGVLTLGIGLWNKYTASLKNASAAMSQAKINDMYKKMRDSAKGAAGATEDQADAMEEAGKAAGKNVQSFDEVHQLQEDMADAAGDAVLDAPALDDLAAPDIPDMGGVLAGFEEELPPFGERVKGFFGWLWDGIKTGAVHAWNWITGTIKGIWQGLVNFTRPIWEPVGKFLLALWGAIKEVAIATWEGLRDLLVSIWSVIVTVAQTVWGVLGPFFSWLWEGIKLVAITAWNLLVSFFTTIWNGIVRVAQTIWNGLAWFFSTLWQGITTVTSAAWEGIKVFLATIWGAISEIANTIWTALAAFFAGVWEGIKETTATIWTTIRDTIVNLFTNARDKVGELADSIKTWVTDKWNAMASNVTRIGSRLREAIIEPFNKAKNTISDIISDAYNWGKNLIDNLIKGIKSMVKPVGEAVKTVVSGVKSFIGFSSPTEKGPGKDADKWAPNLMHMYAQGILANVSLVQGAAGTVAQSLGVMATVPRPALGAVGAGSGPNAMAPVTAAAPEIHLHIGTLIADDYGLKKLEQKLRTIRIYEDQRVGDAR